MSRDRGKDSESSQRQAVSRRDSGMEPVTDMEGFGSPLGAEWGPAMVA